MKHWRRTVVILGICTVFISVTVGSIISDVIHAKEPKHNSLFTVTLPDGLYLYQSGLMDGLFHTTDKDTFVPLFLIENGRLMDPYVWAMHNGYAQFFQKYVSGKTFNVYIGTEKIGTLKKYKFEVCSFLYDQTLTNYMRGHGVYTGRSLPENIIKTRGQPERFTQYRIYPSVKAILTPGAFQTSRISPTFSITQEDKNRLRSAFKRNIATIVEKQKGFNPKRAHPEHVLESQGIEKMMPLDIDGNGKKDLLGIYYYRWKTDKGWWVVDSYLYLLTDHGRAEFLDITGQEFLLGTSIDIDQDGLQEIVINETFESDEVPGVTGERFYILRRGKAGWKVIYRTKGFNFECAEDNTRTYQ